MRFLLDDDGDADDLGEFTGQIEFCFTITHMRKHMPLRVSRSFSGNTMKRCEITSISRKISGNTVNRCEITTAQSDRLCTATRWWLFVLNLSDHTMVYLKRCNSTSVSRSFSGSNMKRCEVKPISRSFSGNAVNRCEVTPISRSFSGNAMNRRKIATAGCAQLQDCNCPECVSDWQTDIKP